MSARPQAPQAEAGPSSMAEAAPIRTTPKKPKPKPRIGSSHKSQRTSFGADALPPVSPTKRPAARLTSPVHRPKPGPSSPRPSQILDNADDDEVVSAATAANDQYSRVSKAFARRRRRRQEADSTDEESSIASSVVEDAQSISPKKAQSFAKSPAPATSRSNGVFAAAAADTAVSPSSASPPPSPPPPLPSNDIHISSRPNGHDSHSASSGSTETTFRPPSATKVTFKVKWGVPPRGPHLISILTTDGDASQIPRLTPPANLPRFGPIAANVEVPKDSPTHLRWRRELGAELADFLNLDAIAKKDFWILEDFPSGYKLLERLEGPATRPTRTVMLHGSWTAQPFLDPKRELVQHLMTLINANGPCYCNHCTARLDRQGGRVVASPPPSDVPPSQQSEVLGELTGPLQMLQSSGVLQEKGVAWSDAKGYHMVDPKTWQANKNPAKINAENSEKHRLLREALRYGGPYVDPHQSQDIERNLQDPSSWVRMKEVVWYTLPRPLRSSSIDTRGGPIITHWPALVCERKTVVSAELIGRVPKPNKPLTSRSLRTQQATEWHVRLLGCTDFVWAATEQLLPFLAYKPFTQPLKSVRPSEESYKQLWNDKEDKPNWPTLDSFGDLENAYLPFAVALSHTSNIMRKIVLSDPFAHRVNTPAPDTAGLLGGQHNESLRNWSSPVVAHYQGVFAGAERIWVGDLLRLRFGKSTKNDILPPDGQSLDPRAYADSANTAALVPTSEPLPSGSLGERCLVLLLSSIWAHPQSDRIFVSGFVYEICKASDPANPRAPPVHPDFPPLPPAPYGWEFRLVAELPSEYSFEIEVCVT